MVARSGDEAQPPRRELILVATIIGSSITFVDGTVVNIALPTIGRDLDAGLSAQQWVALSYSLAVASLYVVSGALGDRYGRWTLFVVGVAGFAAASALAGIAPTVELLIAGRVLQGVAGALLTTNSLALLRATYGEDSGKAVGQWTAWSGIGTVIGPPLGGLLVQVASWRWIFFLNLPFAAVALFMAFAGRSTEDRPAQPRPLQVPGAVAIAVTFGTLTYGLIDGARAGFGAVWLWVSMHLPSPEAPWTAFLPGAIVFGLGLEALHLFTTYFLEAKLANASELYGVLGLATTALFYLFLVGRGVVWAAELNAVVWETRARRR